MATEVEASEPKNSETVLGSLEEPNVDVVSFDLQEDSSTLTNAHDSETCDSTSNHKNMSPGAVKLRGWLNKLLRVEMTDGRSLIGTFLCTDGDSNIILGSCSEYLPEDEENDTDEHGDESRMLGLVMVPGKHIVSIAIDKNVNLCGDQMTPLSEDINADDVI